MISLDMQLYRHCYVTAAYLVQAAIATDKKKLQQHMNLANPCNSYKQQ